MLIEDWERSMVVKSRLLRLRWMGAGFALGLLLAKALG